MASDEEVIRYKCELCPYETDAGMEVFQIHVDRVHLAQVQSRGGEDEGETSDSPDSSETEQTGPDQQMGVITLSALKTCPFCNYTTDRVYSWYRHIHTWHDYSCSICGYRIKNSQDFNAHNQEVKHDFVGKLVHACPNCTFTSEDPDEYWKHRLVDHTQNICTSAQHYQTMMRLEKPEEKSPRKRNTTCKAKNITEDRAKAAETTNCFPRKKQCPYCDYGTVKSLFYLCNHVHGIHDKFCPHCSIPVLNYRFFDSHKRHKAHVALNGTYKCFRCDFKTTDVRVFWAHRLEQHPDDIAKVKMQKQTRTGDDDHKGKAVINNNKAEKRKRKKQEGTNEKTDDETSSSDKNHTSVLEDSDDENSTTVVSCNNDETESETAKSDVMEKLIIPKLGKNATASKTAKSRRVCRYGQKVFRGKLSLKTHVDKCHTGNVCPHCNTWCASQAKIRNHFQCVHDRTCCQCSWVPTAGKTVRKHIMETKHKFDLPCKCINCNFTTNNYAAYMDHRTENHGDKLRSKKVKKTSRTKKSRPDKSNKKSEEKTNTLLACPCCKMSFEGGDQKQDNKSELKSHLAVVHLKMCPHCLQPTKDVDEFKQHLESVHKNDGCGLPFRCPDCSVTTPDIFLYMIHRTNLHQEKLEISQQKVSSRLTTTDNINGEADGSQTPTKDCVVKDANNINDNITKVPRKEIEESNQDIKEAKIEASKMPHVGIRCFIKPLTKCPLCQFVTSNALIMARHMLMKHDADCPHCQEKVDGKYLTHLKMHSLKARLLYCCPDCGIATVQPKDYWQHRLESHPEKLTNWNKLGTSKSTKNTDQKGRKKKMGKSKLKKLERKKSTSTFKCPFCPYFSKMKKHVVRHVHCIHDMQCPYCGEKNPKESMDYHLCSFHKMDNKTFICSECNMSTNNALHYWRHRLNKHLNEMHKMDECRDLQPVVVLKDMTVNNDLCQFLNAAQLICLKKGKKKKPPVVQKLPTKRLKREPSETPLLRDDMNMIEPEANLTTRLDQETNADLTNSLKENSEKPASFREYAELPVNPDCLAEEPVDPCFHDDEAAKSNDYEEFPVNPDESVNFHDYVDHYELEQVEPIVQDAVETNFQTRFNDGLATIVAEQPCPYCDFESQSLWKVFQHVHTTHDLVCPQCDWIVKSPESLAIHVLDVHGHWNIPENLVCSVPMCQEQYDHLEDFWYHRLEMHPETLVDVQVAEPGKAPNVLNSHETDEETHLTNNIEGQDNLFDDKADNIVTMSD